MKKSLIVTALLSVFAMLLVTGCIGFGPSSPGNNGGNTPQVNASNQGELGGQNMENLPEGVKKMLGFLSLSGEEYTIQNLQESKDTYTGTLLPSGAQVYITKDGKYLFQALFSEEGKTNEEKIEKLIESKIPGAKVELLEKNTESGLARYDYLINSSKGIGVMPFYIVDGKVGVQPMKLFDAPDSDVPVIDLFVMSFCPYGRQSEQGIYPVVKLLKDKINITVHYVIYPREMYAKYGEEVANQTCIGNYCSMHGVNELKEDMRQMCIQKTYPGLFWDYLDNVNSKCSLGNIDECWEGIAEDLGMNTTQIQNCAESEGPGMVEQEYALDQKLSVAGSPTLFINGEIYNWVRSPEAYKYAFCSAFSDKPSECGEELDKTVGQASGSCG